LLLQLLTIPASLLCPTKRAKNVHFMRHSSEWIWLWVLVLGIQKECKQVVAWVPIGIALRVGLDKSERRVLVFSTYNT
jgi:hypothetical protein